MSDWEVLGAGDRTRVVVNQHVLPGNGASTGLQPGVIDTIFEYLYDLQRNEGKTIIMVEQNAKKGLEVADYRVRSG